MRSIVRLAPLGIVLAIAGCAPVGQQAGPNVGIAGPAPLVPFPECQTDEYAFVGEASLGAIGLAEIAGGPDSNRVGMIWVTAGPVAMPMPQPVGGGPVPEQDASRFVCVQWPDGSGMGASVPDDWSPPAAALGAGAQATGPEIPLGTVAVIVGAVVLIGFSVIAFRREGGATAGESSSV